MSNVASGVTAVRLLASGDSSLGAGFIAFMIVLVLAVSSFFLFRSMNRHLRNVPANFDQPPLDEDIR
jgi:hypothetical protein